MKQETRLVYNQYSARLAQLNNTTEVSQNFTVEPSVQQKLENKIQESSEFLSKINIIPVSEMEAAKLGLGISGPSAGRTDTDKHDRLTRDLTSLDERGYRCEKTNFDTHIPYAKLDAWAKFKDFQQRIARMIVQRQALDRIMIGFNGMKAEKETNIEKFPLLQDVNKGWLQHLREQAPERVMGLVAEGQPGKVVIGGAEGADYANLDAAVTDAVNLLSPWHQEDTGLVAIVGRKLLGDKYFPIINRVQAPTETLAADIIVSQKRIGNLPAARVPYCPDNAIIITRFDNLSIYYQEGARRRRLVENSKRDRVENYESSNEAYVIEELGLIAALENIELRA